jgi:peptidase M48-like protein
MRSEVQVSPGALYVDRTPPLRVGCSGHCTPSHRNSPWLKEAIALRQRILVGCWLYVLFVLAGPALAQQPSKAVADPAERSAPRLEQVVNDQLLPGYSQAPPWTTALPPINNTNAGSPDPAACANNVADPADRRWQTEWASGRKQAAVFERQVTLITDPAITEYLNRLEQAIVRDSHLRRCFVVKLVNDVETNAYSLPGGFLYVTSGLILNADNEAELVAALAHETGHVTARHLTKIEAQRRIWRRLFLAAGPAGYALGWQLGPLFTRKLLRNAEFEADRLALKYQSASGHDPIELVHLLQDAFQKEGKPASFFVRLFDTHPSTGTRIKRVTKATGRYPQSQTDYVVDTSEFHEVKRRVADVLGVTNPDLRPARTASCGGP